MDDQQVPKSVTEQFPHAATVGAPEVDGTLPEDVQQMVDALKAVSNDISVMKRVLNATIDYLIQKHRTNEV